MKPLACLVGLAFAGLATGCNEKVLDSAKTEGALQHNLEELHEKVASVSCPSGVEVESGKTFTCSVKLTDGTGETATLRIVDDEADVHVIGIESEKAGQ
jgi:hypothetical protein